MLNLLKSIFAKPEEMGKTVDAVIATGDALFYTDEEKAQGAQLQLDWYIKYLDATQSQNVARRLIAVMVTCLFVLLVIISVVVWPFSSAYSTFVFDLLSTTVAVPFTVIMGFYFLKRIKTEK